ncbi:MAG: hypothetical protein Q8Q08_10175 [Candidatus Omnitrophota bacterium]|nr:hypothetical protein [Candidatus Omnitrophota bacterium]MDZ4242208.1 hypothetical protein [Candidatus Omnitrophota bacterium]
MNQISDKRGNVPLGQKWPPALRIAGVALVIVVPLALIMTILSPVVYQSQVKKYVKYKLPVPADLSDIKGVIVQMKMDPEYGFYFSVLADRQIDRAAEEIRSFIAEARNREEFLMAIRGLQEDVRTKAVLLNSLQFPEDLSSAPEAHPEICRQIMAFILKEFELAVLGSCYKGMYHPDFQFAWDDASRRAAVTIRGVLEKMRVDDRLLLVNALP